ELKLDVSLEGRSKEWSVRALVDSRVNDIFLNRRWAEESNVPLLHLGRPVSVLNVDGTKNMARDIIHVATLVMNYWGHWENILAQVTTLGSHPLILGYTWLSKHN
ncbi:hypothetical protein EDD16DRAFT_1443486, partial [Pisolithus croceorrhizus]